MKRIVAIVAVSLVVALTVFGCGHYLPSQGWVTLIDGNTGLDNFNRLGGANWRAEGGAIVADKSTTKGASVLVSKKTFKDFELYAEFWADPDTNSGLYIRCTTPEKVSSASAYEAQIWDKNPNQPFSSGALLPVATVPVPPIYKTGGRWNTYEIHAKGAEITVKLNGVVTVHVQDGRYPSGAIGLQQNAGVIKWRKLLVREL
jgi:hypothetical protein